MLKLIFNFLIFPGFLFASCVGLIAGWVDRKVTARIQWRVGPPWYQNFVDIIKLSGKEIIVPQGAKAIFLLSPFAGLLSAVLAAVILGRSILVPAQSFVGDLIVLLYLLVIPAASLIFGASSSRNPLASVGASREMKMVLGYELPFILVAVVAIIKCEGAVKLGNILSYQMSFTSNLILPSGWVSPSGLIAFSVAILCMQAKLGFVPFDAAEAEQEIMGGTLIEYSGLPLAVFKLTKALLLYTMPLLLIVLFWGKDLRPAFLIVKYVSLLVVVILIKNTNPRLRIDQALRFFWGPMTVLALVAVVLALFGI
ncbi:MAG: NADH-quinone oxidoreductase subunit H [Candidatus Omnitrophica bacterium]|nr:NADH-quinone oxidoreductase subunit H [Candidatus Omnitrophota bacterium]